MGVLRFSDNIQTYEVPRLDDHLIDELFYQEDEIGEMRHTAFMIECGLEEDPPDGPDVPPVPWGDRLLKAHRNGTSETSQSSSSTADSKPIQYDPPKRRVPQRTLPERSRSTDDLDLLEVELSPEANRRKLVASKSGSLHAMRPPKVVKRRPPPRCHSVDDSNGIDLSLAFAKTEGSPHRRGGRKMVAAKSGSLHGMREAAAKAVATKEENGGGGEAENKSPTPRSPVRRLVAAKSGTVHGLRKALQDNATKSAESNAALPPRPAPSSGSLGTRTKSGTNLAKFDPSRSASPANATESHVVYKNGVKTVVTRTVSNANSEIPPRPTMRRSSLSTNGTSSTSTQSLSSSRGRGRQPLTNQSSIGGYSSGSDDDFLLAVVGDSDGDDDSQVSISTDASNDDSPVSTPKKCFVKKRITYCSAPKVNNMDDPSSPSDAKKPAFSKTRIAKSSSNPIEKKKKSTSAKDGSGSDSSLSPSKKVLKGTRREVRSGMTKAERTKSSDVTVESAVSSLRNGASTPSQLLQNMQGSSPAAASPRKLNRAKSGSAKLRSKSVGGLDVPPAFRGL
jgi:hypothetical protein